MRLLRVLFPILGLVVLAGCQDDATRVDEHLARGDAYFEEERYSEAIIEYKSGQQIEPNRADAHYKMAHTYFKLEKPIDGFWELRETVRLDPSNHEALIEFSQLAILANEAEEALGHMVALLAVEDDVRAHLVRGQALDSLERFDEANEVYKQAVAVEPENEAALRAVARSETRAGRKDVARAFWEKLVELHPNFANHVLMARAALRISEDREAGFALREQLALRALEVAEGEERPRAYEQAASFYVVHKRTPEAFALLEAGVKAEEDPVDVLYILARLHRSEGNFEQADVLLEQAAEARPDKPEVHRVLAAYRARQGEFERALESVERAAALDPDDDLARIQKAEILMELGFRQRREGGAEEARAILADVLERQPKNVFALVADAKYQLAVQNPEGGVKQLRAALEVRPDWAEAVYLLGVALASQEDYANARVELGRALELDSSLQGAKAALADVHFKLGEWQYCIERARDYLKAVPDDNKIRLLIAQAMLRLGLPNYAAAELEKIPEETRDGEVFFALGRMRQSEGDEAGARKALEAANEALPDHWEILQAMVVLDRAEGRLDESKARVAAAIEAAPDNAKLYQLRGVLAFNDGRVDDAEADFKYAIEIAPSDLHGYERLARFYARLGRLEDTTKAYESAIEVDPEAAQIHHYLGVLHELSGDSERAIQRYESAIRHGPANAEAKNNLAYLYADRNEQLDRALDLAQEAKQLLPDNPSVADTLGWVLYRRGVHAAAVSYLKEAESRTDPSDASVALIRFHLAQALAANGDGAEALQAVDRSLAGLADQLEAARKQGGASDAEPDWVSEARALQAELQSQHAAAN